MSKQPKKHERMIYVRDNKFDPFNTKKRDHNPNKLKAITDDVINTYFKCRNWSCPLDWYKNKNESLRISNYLPTCISSCKNLLTVHNRGGKGVFQSPVVETMTGYIKGNKNAIYISRGLAYWLWSNKIPMIFRPCWENGFVLHHTTGDPLEDDKVCIIRISLHNKINGAVRKIDQKILSAQKLLSQDEKNFSLRKQICDLYDEKRRISLVNNDDEVWSLIDKLYTEACNLSEI